MRCFNQFAIIHELVQDKEDVHLITKSVLDLYASENTKLLELRTTPKATTLLTAAEYTQIVIEAIKEYQEKTSAMKINILLSIDRGRGYQAAENVLSLAREWHCQDPDLVPGVDLSGNPSVGDFSTYAPLLAAARKDGIKLAIHAAEVPNPNEVKSILDFHPDRIGHGTCIHPSTGGSDDLWKQFKEQKIPVEVCLTSNVISGTVQNLRNHHIKYLWEEKSPFAICCDDCGIFQTSLDQELQLAQETLAISKETVFELSRQAIDFSFLNEFEKDKLKNEFTKWKFK